MPAVDHTNPEQLSMFMSAREIKAGYKINHHERGQVARERPGGGTGMWIETDDQTWGRKLAESKRPGGWNDHEEGKPSVHQSVGAEGVRMPVHLATSSTERQIGNGYHRVAAAADHDPDRLMPVLHSSTLMHANVLGKTMPSEPATGPLSALGGPRKRAGAPGSYDGAAALLKAITG